jgi:Rps23 Pro-64 3,4-dihydroxylase Tpa1-like proline 4-hydroxylase
MTRKKARSKQKAIREIAVQIHLDGGHQHDILLPENSADLASLFRVLASRGSEGVQPDEQFFQLPVDKGRAACSFNSSQLVSVITKPPVVIQIQQPETPPPQVVETLAPPVVVQTPRHMIIDDFLGVDEHRDMLAYALANEDQFAAGTVTTNDAHYRQNLVIMDFHDSAHSKLIQNRLLTWYPQIALSLGMELFPVGTVESQLTASNDGHYFRAHKDGGEGETQARVLTCVYYFFRQPRAFAGGALRLYDSCLRGGHLEPASTYPEIEPVSNRLVVFSSDAHHELMQIRCPSRKFHDSRFAVTNWIQRAEEPDAAKAFGWGHLRCGVVPPDFGLPEEHQR